MAEITGTTEGEVLTGTAEADTISGDRGADTLTGGGGVDVFRFFGPDSLDLSGLSNVANLDVITDWTAADRFLVAGGNPPGFSALLQSVANTYEDAYGQAVDAYGRGFEYASIKVGNDVFVFSKIGGHAVRLPGANQADITRASFISGTLDGGLLETGSAGGDARAFGDGPDRYDAAAGDDLVNGGEGNDTLLGGQGDDQVFGGLDNDSVTGGEGRNYLRGEDGDDVVQGGIGFDDINGNMGRDSLYGGEGDDWVVGGKDDDVVFGEGGHDIVYGNIGADSVGGGVGTDTVRGGQGDDLVRGDDGADIVAGDLGADTLEGGLGADIFIAFGAAGLDRVNDFRAGDGDRVFVDGATPYTLAQVDADTVIDFGGGNRMVLVGVQLSSLPAGWIFGG